MILDKQSSVLEKISNTSDGVVDKNIIKSPNSTFGNAEPSQLTSREKNRTKEASSIFISKFFEESKRQRPDSKEKTRISKPPTPSLTPLTPFGSKKAIGDTQPNSKSLLDSLMGMLGLGALGGRSTIGKILSPIFSRIGKILSPIFNKLWGVVRKLGSSIWGGVKSIMVKVWNSVKGGLSKVWGGLKSLGTSVWNSVKGGLSKVWGGLKSLGTSVWNSVKGGLSKVWGGLKSLGTSVWNSVKGGLSVATASVRGGFSKVWNSVKGGLSKVWGGLKSLGTSVWNSVKGGLSVATASVRGGFVKMVGMVTGTASGIIPKNFTGSISKSFSVISTTITNTFSGISSSLTKIGGELVSALTGMSSKIANSESTKSLFKTMDTIGSHVSNMFKTTIDKAKSVISNITSGISTPKSTPIPSTGATPPKKTIMSSAFSLVKKVATKGGDAWKTAVNVTSKGVGVVSRNVASAAKHVGRVSSNIGKAVVGMPLELAKKTVTTAAGGVIKSAGGMTKLLGRIVSKIPLLGAAIEAAFTAKDLSDLQKQNLPLDELQTKAGKRVLAGVGGMLGSAGGAALGGTIGTLIPIPVVGTALGSIVGGLAGDVAGRWLSGIVTDYILPAKYTKTIGAFVTNTPPPTDEMQDFIIRGREVYRFSNKDEVMGIKRGGAISEFLNKGSGRTQNNTVITRADDISIGYLKNIATNTAYIAKNMLRINNGASERTDTKPSIYMSTPHKTQSQFLSFPDNRPGYANSAYAL